jgi:hypothetical protein
MRTIGLQLNLGIMSDTEDYPGPSYGHSEKKGQDPRGRANEDMTKPAARINPICQDSKSLHRVQTLLISR